MIIEANAHLIGLYILLPMYGLYIATLVECIGVLRRRYNEGIRSMWLPVATLLIFIITNLDVFFATVRSYDAFSIKRDSDQTAEEFYAVIASPTSVTKNVCFVMQTLVADAIMIYRTALVWNYDWRVLAVPIALLCADFATGVFGMNTLAHSGFTTTSAAALVTLRIKYFFVVTLVLNILCALLIAWKVWLIQTSLAGARIFGSRRLWRMVEIIIESAAIYCACLVALIILASTNSGAYFIALDPTPSIMAVVFTFVIIRASKTQTSPSMASTTARTTTGSLNFLRTFGGTPRSQEHVGVEVHLEEVIYKHDADESRGEINSSGTIMCIYVYNVAICIKLTTSYRKIQTSLGANSIP
ncbi:unnamed protein product [Somion occarium]|uniref:Gustatory receptor n=1 Tax=Somion occarium TaxID=3059160 RepID=A0ABP1DNK2_9APHY